MGYSHISSDLRIHCWMKLLPALSSWIAVPIPLTGVLFFLSWFVPRGLQGVLSISPRPYFPCPYCGTQVVLLRHQLLPRCC